MHAGRKSCQQGHAISVRFTRLAPRDDDSRSRPLTLQERLESISANEVLINAPKSAHKYSSRSGGVKNDAGLHPDGLSHPSAVFHMQTNGRGLPLRGGARAVWNLSSTEYAVWKLRAAVSSRA
jgi:hypothetical protein